MRVSIFLAVLAYCLTATAVADESTDRFRALEERLYPPEMKTDDNGYRLIVRNCGDMPERFCVRFVGGSGQEMFEMTDENLDPEPLRLQTYEKLGLDPNAQPTLKKIECPYTFIFRYDKENKPEHWTQSLFHRYNNKTFWTFEDFPMLKEWLDANTETIDLISEAVRKPAFRIPLVREDGNAQIIDAVLLLDEMTMLRQWFRAVQARIQYRLGIGDIDGALDDTETIYRLARIMGRQEGLTIGYMGAALEGAAATQGISDNPQFPPSKKQFQRLFQMPDISPPRASFDECLELVRSCGIPDAVWMALCGAGEESFREVWRRCECSANMKRLTIALLLHEKEHGKLPDDDWREAVKPYLGTQPEKYFRCPSHPLAEDETAYAMVAGEANDSPYRILLVEVTSPQKLGEGTGRLPREKAVFWTNWDEPRPDDFDGLGSFHSGGINVGHRSGAVRFMSETVDSERLQSLLDGSATSLQ